MLILAMLFSLSACSIGNTDIFSVGGFTTFKNFISTLNHEKIVEDLGENTVKIGVFEPESGIYSGDAYDELRGIKLANKLYPKAGDQTVELIYEDNHSDTVYAAEAAQNLVDRGCNIVIGSYSNVLTMASIDTFEENKVVCISPSCTNPLITTTTDHFFRVGIVDSFQGNSAAKYVIEHLPIILHGDGVNDGDDYLKLDPVKCVILKKTGDERATALIERFQAKMQEVYGENGYVKVIEYSGAGNADMTPFFDRMVEAEAEAVFFPSTADEGDRVLFEASRKGYEFSWIGGSDWAGLIDAASEAGRPNNWHLEGVSYVAAFDKQAEATGMTKTFLSAVERYYKETEPSEAMALGFDAYLLAIQAIQDAGGASNSENLQYATNRLMNVECATGNITFRSGTGDPVKDVIIEKIVGGQITAEYTAAPNWGNN